ncbi:hypothetical protein JTB14_030890 [Gonioctena quinquepunctata]|nr:hypothetical protein JTB14_030890 [Gonioctena quinquepunctata]
MDNIPRIANLLRSFTPEVNSSIIKGSLPIAFRCEYKHVRFIIDCLEIEIQKPSKAAVHQVLTWSEYKKANTLRYLILCTPDDLINYIFRGYGERISDVLLVANCNFLDNLPPGVCILADRGFKHIEELLLQKGSQLLGPLVLLLEANYQKQMFDESKKLPA